MNKKKILIYAGLAIVLGFFFWVYLIVSGVPEIKPKITIAKVYANALHDSLFFRHESRGLNYDVTVITKTGSQQYVPNKEIDYFFPSTGLPIFYKVEADSLIIYTEVLARAPKTIPNNFKIKQIKISQSETEDLERTYHEKGLEIFRTLERVQ